MKTTCTMPDHTPGVRDTERIAGLAGRRHAARRLDDEAGKRRVGDAGDGDVVDLPAGAGVGDVGADAEPQLHGLTGESGAEREAQRVTPGEGRAGCGERTASGERVAAVRDHRAVVPGVGSELGDVAPRCTTVGRQLDHAAVERYPRRW